jgi:hypothetical protein
MYKIIGADQKEYGPISAEQIRQWITEGRVNAQTMICLDGTQDWKPLASFPEFGALPSSSPPLAAPASKPPGSIKVFGILNIVFGSLGILCTPISLIFVMVASQKLGYSPFMTQWVVASGIVGILGACVLLASGIGLLKMRPWSRKLAVYYAMFACALTVINTLVTLTNLPSGGPNPEGQKIGAFAGAAFGLAIGLTYNFLLIFFLSKPAVKEALGEKE